MSDINMKFSGNKSEDNQMYTRTFPITSNTILWRQVLKEVLPVKPIIPREHQEFQKSVREGISTIPLRKPITALSKRLEQVI